MAKERSRRENAGSKMARLLNNEDQDEFYSSVYGGFNEEQDDIDYQSESSGGDVVDSDFDANEDEEVKSDEGDDQNQSKRKKRVVTKAYKEPKRQKTTPTPKPSKSEVKVEEQVKPRVTRTEKIMVPDSIEKKTLRRSTAVKSAAAERREKERQARQQHLKDIAVRLNVPEVRRLTQEELLEEAKITEEINTRSLLQYQRLEIEKKKAKIQKQVNRGPVIRYQSLTMPDIDDDPNVFGVTVDYETGQVNEKPVIIKDGKCERTFITFTDDTTFKQVFPSGSSKARVRPRERFCPVSGRPARYMDPLTRTPYADSAAFRVLRHLYSLHVDTGEKPISLLRKFRSGEIQISDVC